MNAVLIQQAYQEDGVYRFQCNNCHGLMDERLTMTDYEKPSGIIEGFPIKFCYHCGIKFDQWLIWRNK